MGEASQSVVTLDMIARRLSPEVLNQPIFKAKVVFLGVDRKDPGYSKQKKFSANGHDYMVEDGGISYLPLEAKNALENAVSYITRPANKRQAEEGIDADNPADKYEKIKDPRFDITVLDTYKVVIGEDGSKHLKSDNEISATELEVSNKKILEEQKEFLTKQIREELQAEYDAKLEAKVKELEKNVPEPISDEDLKKLIGDEESSEENE